MNRQRLFLALYLRVPVAAAAVLLSSTAFGVLENRYTFNDGTVTDSIGTADGVLVDPSGIAFYAGGEVQLTNNNGASSAQDFSLPTTVGAYVDLPNGLVSNAANNGDFFEFSLEFWTTVEENRNWARIGDFGVSDGGEDVSGSGAMSDYLIVVPQTGGGAFAASTHSLTGQEDFVPDPAGPLPTGMQHHIVVAVDQNDTTAGANGTLNLFLNNSLVATGPVEDEGLIDFTFINDVNNWLGRAQWGDPLFDGSFNEFSVYSHSLDAAEVNNNFVTGPIQPVDSFPKLQVDRATGEISILVESGEPSQLDLESYEIGSAVGGLDTAGWMSIDASNFDTNGTWTNTSLTDLSIAENTTGDGGPIAPGGEQTIGSAWMPSPFEDLTFSYSRVGGPTLTGQVEYVGSAIQAADLDADGDIDEDDFNLFAANTHTDLSGLSALALYRAGDLDGDGDNDYADFRLFKAGFIAANGASAFSALAASVPEPTSVALLSLSLLGFLKRFR